MSEVTQILAAIEGGDVRAAEELLPLVYQELRQLATQKMSQEAPGQTLQATALVHEAYIRLVGAEDQNWDGRGHFFSAAAEAMRRILIDIARRKKSLKYGGDHKRVDLDDVDFAIVVAPEQLIALNEAISKLVDEDRAVADLVKLRYFVGLTIEQAAEVLKVSPRTAYRYWAYARARMHQELTRED
jgi:RNA polymerase sigma factor (TIGR02999 family)